jgi:hypothetical protein
VIFSFTYQEFAVLAGLLCDFGGVFLLFYPDWRSKRTDVLIDRLPDDYYEELVDAEFEWRPSLCSDAEKELNKYEGNSSAVTNLRFTKLAGGLILLGFFFQIIALFI